MPLIPFASQECVVIGESTEFVRIQTNSGMSPFWIFVVLIAFFQDPALRIVLIGLCIVMATYRTHWLVDAKQRLITREQRFFSYPVFRLRVSFNVIREFAIVPIKVQMGTEYGLFLTHTLKGSTSDTMIAQRAFRERLLTILSRFALYVPEAQQLREQKMPINPDKE
jgi:hypothetical protein